MENHRSLCPINLTLEIFGDKWSFIIIRDMMFRGKRYFRELLQSEEKIASNILADRLAMLEREGIITKQDDPAHKHAVEMTNGGKALQDEIRKELIKSHLK